jgi:hypothetical protein
VSGREVKEASVGEAAERPNPLAAAPAGPSLHRRVLALQRTHGNVAVTRMIAARGEMVARNGPDGGVPTLPGGIARPERIEVPAPRVGDVADMDRAISGHMHNEDWGEADRVLNGFNQADIDTRIVRYEQGQRANLAAAADVNGGAADRIRKPVELESSLFYNQWERAARVLDGYPEAADRVPWHLRRIGAWDIAHILHAAQATHLAVVAAVSAVVTQRSAEIAGFIPNAFTTGNWLGAAVLLNAVTDTEMAAGLANRTAPMLFEVKTAAERSGVARVVAALGQQPHAGLIQVEGWDRELRRQIAAADWPGAATTLVSYSTVDDRRNRLRWMHLPQLEALSTYVRGASAPHDTLRAVVEEERVRKLGEMYEASLGGEDWAAVVRYLNTYNDTDLLAKAQLIQSRRGAYGLTRSQAAAAAIWSDTNYRVRRTLAFLVAAPGPRAPSSFGAGTFTPGTAASTTAVPGGSVTVTTGDTLSGQNDWFGLAYTDTPGSATPQAARTGWVQFIAIEIESFDAGGRSLGFETAPPLPAAVAGFPITPSQPGAHRWYLDTLGANAPFYEAPSAPANPGSGGAHQTTPQMTAMYDRPSSDPGVVRAIFDRPNVARVVERERFHDYLARDREILFRSELFVQFQWTSKPAVGAGDPPRTLVPVSAGPASAMTRGQFNDLVSRYPVYAYFPHA